MKKKNRELVGAGKDLAARKRPTNAAILSFWRFNKSLNKNRYARKCQSAGGVHEV